MSLRMGAFRDWLAELVEDGTFVVRIGPDWDEMPDEQILATVTGGPRGQNFEGAFDDVTVQVRVRGGQLDYEGAESKAHEVDKVLLGSGMFEVGGQPVLSIYRWSGPPTPDPWDTGSRTVFTTNYVVAIGTD